MRPISVTGALKPDSIASLEAPQGRLLVRSKGDRT